MRSGWSRGHLCRPGPGASLRSERAAAARPRREGWSGPCPTSTRTNRPSPPRPRARAHQTLEPAPSKRARSQSFKPAANPQLPSPHRPSQRPRQLAHPVSRPPRPPPRRHAPPAPPACSRRRRPRRVPHPRHVPPRHRSSSAHRGRPAVPHRRLRSWRRRVPRRGPPQQRRCGEGEYGTGGPTRPYIHEVDEWADPAMTTPASTWSRGRSLSSAPATSPAAEMPINLAAPLVTSPSRRVKGYARKPRRESPAPTTSSYHHAPPTNRPVSRPPVP